MKNDKDRKQIIHTSGGAFINGNLTMGNNSKFVGRDLVLSEKARVRTRETLNKHTDSQVAGQQPVDVVILTVLPEEYLAVCHQLENLQAWLATSTSANLYAWQTGTVFSKTYEDAYRVMVGVTGRAGNSQSTMATLEAIALEEPRYVLFSGIAGGLMDFEEAAWNPNFEQDIHTGDIVIANVIHGYEYGKVGAIFNPRDDWTYQTDQGLLTKAIAYKSNPFCRKRIKVIRHQEHQPKILIGEVASGDKVVDDPTNAFFTAVYRKWPKVKAVEMEGAGIGAAIIQARDRGKAVGFLMIRGISDIPRPPDSIASIKEGKEERGTRERDRWKSYAADIAAAFTVGLIAEGLPVPPKEKN